MPRTTAKKVLLGDLDDCVRYAMLCYGLEGFQSDSDDESNSEDLQNDSSSGDLGSESDTIMSDSSSASDDNVHDMNEHLANLHRLTASYRYVVDRNRVPRSEEYKYIFFLSQTPDDFRTITRVSKELFDFILGLIQHDPIFHNSSRCQQAPVHWQLACALDRLGNDGQGVSAARSKVIWGLGHGTVLLYYSRVVHAISKLRNNFIQWPNAVERQQISLRNAEKGFKGAVGFVDGTTFPLHSKPSFHGNNYLDRKKNYSINAQVVCDDRHKILHFLTGMPGSCHDSRVFSQSPLVQHPENSFSDGEYLLADSGYAASHFLVPAYKDRQEDDPNNPHEQRDIEVFNTHLAKARVVNEHTIGVLKSRWSSLRGLRIYLRKRQDILKVIHHTIVCVILHNIALEKDPWDESDVLVDESSANPSSEMGDTVNLRRSVGQQKWYQVRLACQRMFAEERRAHF